MHCITKHVRSLISILWSLGLSLSLTSSSHAAADRVFADFEGDSYGDWVTSGEAFGKGPARGALPGQMAVSGFAGQGLVNSFLGGDRATGVLASPRFTLEHRYIRFLIGGGAHAGQTCLNLIANGEVVRTATGPNLASGGSEELAWSGWDVAELLGKEVAFEIVDRATEGWGHINVDQITLTDRPLPRILSDPSRELVATGRYLNLPVKDGAKQRWVSLKVGGKVERDLRIELADGTPDWWAYLDLAPFAGQKFTVGVDQLSEDSQALNQLRVTDQRLGATDLYREPLRPQFHFSPLRGWNNDPNGLVYFEGRWHLFFQHNPYGWNWGNMHWGHASSPDLVHWEESGDVLFPDALGTMFSGSAVVDWKNTSGFGRAGVPPLVAFYTAAGGDNRLSAGQPFTQCLAYSADGGRTWTKFEGNPILKNISSGNRDPKVLWHAPSQRWIMTLFVEVKGVHTIQFFASTDLKQWQFLSQTDGFFECPDFFELPVHGGASGAEPRKWVLTAASSEYQVGTFDGTRFIPETPKLPGHRGKGFYAAQTYSDAPDGRRVQIGWGQMPSPGMPFNQLMCLPTELTLHAGAAGPRLRWWPVKELAVLRARSEVVPPGPLPPGKDPFAGFEAELAELEVDLELGEANECTVELRGTRLTYSRARGELALGDRRVPCPLREGRLRLRAFVDRTSLEVFAADGEVYLPWPVVSAASQRRFSLTTAGGEARIHQASWHALRSAWPPAVAHN